MKAFVAGMAKRDEFFVCVIPRLSAIDVSQMMDVKFLGCGFAGLALELVTLKNAKSFFLPAWVGQTSSVFSAH